MKSLFNLLFRLLGISVVALGSILIAMAITDSDYSTLIIAIPLFFVGVFIFRLPSKLQKKRDESIRKLPEFKDTDFFHAHGGTAIGVNKKDEKLILHLDNLTKVYPFSQVRSWRYTLQYGGAIYGSGAAVAGGNLLRMADNVMSSGLFVETKDIDHPEWRISFVYRPEAEQEMKKWVEILRQSINES